MSSIWIWKAYLSIVLSLPKSNGKRGYGRESWQLRLACYCQYNEAQFTLSCGIFGKLQAKRREAKKKKKAFKSVPLSSKLQPCIFNFLSPYNVIHWHPSQTRAPADCIALQDKLSSHAVATCQERRGVTEKMHSLM